MSKKGTPWSTGLSLREPTQRGERITVGSSEILPDGTKSDILIAGFQGPNALADARLYEAAPEMAALLEEVGNFGEVRCDELYRIEKLVERIDPVLRRIYGLDEKGDG